MLHPNVPCVRIPHAANLARIIRRQQNHAALRGGPSLLFLREFSTILVIPLFSATNKAEY